MNFLIITLTINIIIAIVDLILTCNIAFFAIHKFKELTKGKYKFTFPNLSTNAIKALIPIYNLLLLVCLLKMNKDKQILINEIEEQYRTKLSE